MKKIVVFIAVLALSLIGCDPLLDLLGLTETETKYHVEYHGNGNTGGSVPIDNNDYEQGDTVTVAENSGGLVRTGFEFAGWNTTSDATGTTYSGGDTFVMVAESIDLYAEWSVENGNETLINELYPAPDSADIAVNVTIRVEFSRSVSLVTPESDLIHLYRNDSEVSGRVMVSESKIEFSPTLNLELGVQYKVSVGPLTMADGVEFDKLEWYFTTLDSAKVPSPMVNVPSGQYSFAPLVQLSVNLSYANIYFTVDGTAPVATEELLYTGPIPITADTELRAIGVREGFRDSDVAIAQYSIEVIPMTGIQSVQASPGGGFIVALDSYGSMWSWGANYHGALGQGNEYHYSVPVKLMLPNQIVDVAVGLNFVLALDSVGQLWSWGNSPYSLVDSSSPSSTTYFSGMTGIELVKAGSHDGFVVTTDGTFYSWGYNSTSLPSILSSDAVDVTASSWVILLQTGAASVRTSRRDYDDFTVSLPETVVSIAATETFYAAVTLGGDLYLWSHLNYRRVPLKVDGVDQIVHIDAHAGRAIVLQDDGTVWTLSINSELTVTSLEQVFHEDGTALSAIVDVACASGSFFAVDTNGFVWVWGNNYYGILGDGTTVNRPYPVRTFGN